MEGYKNSKPDVGWWMKEIRAGEEFRKEHARQQKWAVYRNFYRNRFKPGIFTKNIFFTMRRSMVPRIYFRNPAISVVPTKPGGEQAALAKVMERTFNRLMKLMLIKEQMRGMNDVAFITGTGVGKLGFGAEFTPTPAAGGTEIPITSDGFKVETRAGIVDNMPWFLNINPKDFVLPQYTDRNRNAFFQAHWVKRYRDDVLNDPRFNKIKKWTEKVQPMNDNDPVVGGGLSRTRDMIDILEIRDRRNKSVIVLAPNDTREILYHEEDELQTDYSSPFYVYTPNPDDEVVWGISDSAIQHQYQEQLNEIKTKQHWHMRLSIIKLLVEKGSITDEEAEKLRSEDVGAVVEVGKMHGIQPTNIVHQIPDALFQMEDRVMADVREVMGFSRNQFGEYNARSHGPTTVETREVAQAVNLRTDERRDMLSDILVNVFQDLQLIIFKHWSKEQVTKVVGPEGHTVWVKFSGKMLRQGQYEIMINPDTAVTETKEVREQRAFKYYEYLSQNPRVDADKLSRWFLNELPGVAFDDILMDQQPTDPRALSISELGNQIDLAGSGGLPVTQSGVA